MDASRWTSEVSPRRLGQAFVPNSSQEVVKQREGCCLCELDNASALACAENTSNFRFSAVIFWKVALVEQPKCRVLFDDS
jgi:hypothetical protein